MLSMGVTMFGCGAFTDAQREMCTCSTKASRTEQLQKLVTHRLYGHPKLNEALKKTDQEVEDIARRVGDSPKYSVMVHHILQKYNASLIAFKSHNTGNKNSEL